MDFSLFICYEIFNRAMNNFDYVCGSLVFPADFSGAVILYMDGDLEGIFWKKIFNILRPFHKAWTSAVEIVVKSYIQGLRIFGDAVKVKMIDAASIISDILVYYGKGRRGYFFTRDAKAFADGFCKGCLSGSHRCIECYEAVRFKHFLEFGGSAGQAVKILNC